MSQQGSVGIAPYRGPGIGPTSSQYTEHPERESWPEPEMVNTVIHREGYAKVRAVKLMVQSAEANGWAVKVTHARGAWPTTGGKPSRQRDSLAVRMSRGDQRAVAVYVEAPTEGGTWSWDTLYTWTLAQPIPTRYPSVTAFKPALT